MTKNVTEVRARSVDIDPLLEAAVWRAQSDFLEMPGLKLTLPQAARLWAFDASFCREVLARLVESRFLIRSRDAFIRADDRA